MTDHTPEPWPRPWPGSGEPRWIESQGVWIYSQEAHDRARACVNACAGIPTEQLGDVKALVGFAEGFERYCGSIPAKLLTPGLSRQLLGARTALALFRRKD